MAKGFSLFDTILTWIERIQSTPWGGKVVALVATLLISVAQWFWGLPLVLIVPLAIITFAALVFLLLALPVFMNRIWPFPFAASVPTLCEADDNIQAHVLILNRQPERRMAVSIELYFKAYQAGSGHWYHTADAGDTRAELGPGEMTEGVVVFRVETCDVDKRRGSWHLRITDMVSNRSTKLFKIPGCYPPNEQSLQPHRPATFTKTSQQTVLVTKDWGVQLRRATDKES